MRIGLDIDGVLADFDSHFLNYLNFEDKTPSKVWDDPRISDNFYKIANDIDFWMSMPCLVEADTLDFNPVVYVTARDIPSSVTSEWLYKNGFPEAPVISVGKNGNKVDILKNNVDIFVDDHIKNYNEINRGGVNCLLMTTSYNKHFNVEHRITSLNEVLNYD